MVSPYLIYNNSSYAANNRGRNTTIPVVIGSLALQSGTTVLGMLDSESVNVYSQTHGVILLYALNQPSMFEYVREQLSNTPKHLPVLIIVQF